MNKDKIIKDLKERNDKLVDQRRQFEARLYHEQYLSKEKDKEIERLNNIINELEKTLFKKIEAIKTIKDMLGENAKVINPHIEVLETEYNYFLDKLKELKEGNKNET